MKATGFTLLILIVAIGIAQTAAEPTLTFSPANLHLSDRPASGEYSIVYDSCRLIKTGKTLALPGRVFYVDISGYQHFPDITWQLEARELIADLKQPDALDDTPTGEAGESARRAIEFRARENLGRYPVHVADRMIVADQQWIKLMVFPVTVDQAGRCYLNQALTILADSLPLESSNLKTEIATVTSPTSKTGLLSTSPDSTVEYLIVTSAEFAPSVEPLVSYKNVTGIRTSAELITDILAAYDGRDDAERLRERLKQFYHDGGSHVLLAGDETQLPLRYAYPYSTSSQPASDVLQICDLYFADLSGEWDADNDGVWGEKYVDEADFTPEVTVGRLPFSSPQEIDNYIEKLIAYETNPGNGDFAYLDRAIIFCSDEMRDYSGGQHSQVAEAYPDGFEVDTTHGIELASGSDPSPYNLPASELETVLSGGYGIVNILAHGNNHVFGVRTTAYNEWPKSYFQSVEVTGDHGYFGRLEANQKVSLYYSLACDNGAFDKDQPPINDPYPNLVQCLLALKDAGAVAFVANSRWGWVGSSYLIQKAFLDSLFASPDLSPPQALSSAKAVYSYYRDQVMGLNYYGDPTLKIYRRAPEQLAVSIVDQGANLLIRVASDQNPVSGCRVALSLDGELLVRGETGNDGIFTVTCDLQPNHQYTIAAAATGFPITLTSHQTTVVTGVEAEDNLVPNRYRLLQNYPNPFNPSTVIGFHLAANSRVSLTVFNTLGQTVSVILDATISAGPHYVEWDGTDFTGERVASGIYFYRLETSEFTDIKKMTLVR